MTGDNQQIIDNANQNSQNIINNQKDIAQSQAALQESLAQSEAARQESIAQSEAAQREDIAKGQKENDDKNAGLITGALEALGDTILDGIKSLFLPSDGFFEQWFMDLNDFFSDRFGFLYAPMDILVRLCEMILSSGGGDSGIPIPEISWDGYVLIPAQTFSFNSVLSIPGVGDIQKKLYFVTNLIMIGALLSLAHRKLEGVLKR